MPTQAETLFLKLQNPHAIDSLIGKSEDATFDCKEWRGFEANRGSIAKAACAFANAEGGVIVIGVKAVGRGKEPDLVQELCPVADCEAVRSVTLDIILKSVDPGIQGVQAAVVPAAAGGASGFVLVHVPEAGSLQRSRVDWRFHVRIASGTVPMEMFQIADRFGRRPQADLRVLLTEPTYGTTPGLGHGEWREYTLQVSNEGRGLARYPALFLRTSSPVSRGAFDSPLWPESPANGNWVSYRGGANDVIYPGETRDVRKLYQRANVTEGGVASYYPLHVFTKVVCLDMAERSQTTQLEGGDSAV